LYPKKQNKKFIFHFTYSATTQTDAMLLFVLKIDLVQPLVELNEFLQEIHQDIFAIWLDRNPKLVVLTLKKMPLMMTVASVKEDYQLYK
jgi:hypothetical protein